MSYLQSICSRDRIALFIVILHVMLLQSILLLSLQEDFVHRNDVRSLLNSESHRLDSSQEAVVLKVLNSRLISTSDHAAMYFLSITDPNLTRHFFVHLRSYQVQQSAIYFIDFLLWFKNMYNYHLLISLWCTHFVLCLKNTHSKERRFDVLMNYLAVTLRNVNDPNQFVRCAHSLSTVIALKYQKYLFLKRLLFIFLMISILKICELKPLFRFHGFKFAKIHIISKQITDFLPRINTNKNKILSTFSPFKFYQNRWVT